MITHAVIFKLHHLTGSTNKTDFFKEAKTLAAIPGVENFKISKQTNPKNDLPYCISMEFANSEKYQQYLHHPLHQTFVQQYWAANVSAFLEIDLEPIDAI